MKICLFTIVIIKKFCAPHDNFHSLNIDQSFQKIEHDRPRIRITLYVGFNYVSITFVALTNLHFCIFSILIQILKFFIFIRVRLFLSTSD